MNLCPFIQAYKSNGHKNRTTHDHSCFFCSHYVCEKATPVTSLPWSACVCENLSPVMRPEEALPLGMRAALAQQSWAPLLSHLQLPEAM